MSEENKQPLVAVIAENAVLTQASSFADAFYSVTVQISVSDVKRILELDDVVRSNMFLRYTEFDLSPNSVEHFAIVSQAWLETARKKMALSNKLFVHRVNQWHLSDTAIPIHEWCGLTEEEYKQWINEQLP